MSQTRLPMVPPDRIGAEHPEENVSFPFSGGRNRSMPPHMIAQTDCYDLKNFCYPRESSRPRTRPGMLQFSGKNLLEANRMPGDIVAMTVFHKSAAAYYVVCACKNAGGTALELWYVDPADGQDYKIGDLGAASLIVPTFATYGGCLYIAQAGQYIKEWQGETSTSPAAAAATITLTAADYRHILPPAWVAATNYADGDFVIPTVENGFYYEVTTDAGSSHATTEPTWPTTPGATVVDAGITWTCRTPGNTITIAGDTWTFETARVNRWEIADAASNNDLATNIRAAINADSTKVAATGATDQIVITARSVGTHGNALTAADATGAMTGAGTLAGGVNGVALDSISTTGAPKPGIIGADKNQRIFAAGDTTAGNEDTVFFSAAINAWEWGIGSLYNGVLAKIGYLNGNSFTAIVPFIDVLMVHKNGQNPDVYRLFVGDTDPVNWHVSMFSGHAAALSAPAATTVSGKHIVLDRQTLRIYAGTDTYESIDSGSGLEALKVVDLLERTTATAFIVSDMHNVYTLVFPQAGNDCAVYSFASGRWAHWRFASSVTPIKCGAWSEALGKVLLAAGKVVCALDMDTSTDLGQAFEAKIIGPAHGGGDTMERIILHSILDYEVVTAANISIGYLSDRNESNYSELESFISPDYGSYYTPETYYTDAGGVDITPLLYSQKYVRHVTTQQGQGATISPVVKVTSGAVAINSLTMRLAAGGRVAG